MADKIISLVGAGGKTSYIHRAAEAYVRQGMRVLITTTTHMYLEPETDISCDPMQIIGILAETGLCMAGKRCEKEPSKIEALPTEVWKKLLPYCDIVLVEADGARHYPVKYPRETEPVIPEETTDIIAIMNQAAIGQKISDAVFRQELLCRRYGLKPSDEVTKELLIRILREAYCVPLQEKYPDIVFRALLAANSDYELLFMA